MQRHDWSSMSQKNPCYTSLHLTALATSGSSHQVQDTDACIQNDHRLSTLLLHSLLRIYIPSRSLRSASERRLVVPSQRGSKSLSRTFSFTVPGWWNNLPTPIRNAGSLSIFKQQLKTHLFQTLLDFILNIKKKKKNVIFPLSFSPSFASLYLFEQWLRLGVTSTSVWLLLKMIALCIPQL